MSKAVVFLAPGSEECEALLVVDILRRAGVEVTVAAVDGDKTVVTSHKVSVNTDALAAEIDPADYQQFLQGINTLTPTESKIFAYYLSGKSVKEILSIAALMQQDDESRSS